MKKSLCIVLCLIFISCKTEVEKKTTGKTEPYEIVDLNSKNVPDSLTTSNEIAHFLTENLTNTDEKVRAIHIWIAKNIQYDLDKVNSKTGNIDKLIQETLEDKAGVCHHYAQLFHQMCQEIGVKSFFISGYTIDDRTDKMAATSHAWNGVQIDSSYYFIDNTWAAGYLKNDSFVQNFRDNYFLISPKEFVKTHMPFSDFFQFLNTPLSYEDFEKRDFSKLSQGGIYNFVDSITRFQDLDKLNKLYAENIRLKRDNTNNPLITEKLSYNILVIDNLIYGKMSEKYTRANEKIKTAFSLNNQFIEFMNSRVTETETIKSEMQNVIRKAVKNYRQGNVLLLQLKKDKSKLSDQSKLNELVDEYINQLHNNIQTLRKSLKLHALYADLTIK